MFSLQNSMKLFMITQALDLDDPVLSVYHGWVVELAIHVETLEVVVLKEGRHELPANVRVYSLGKEEILQGTMIYHSTLRPVVYAWRFLKLVWKLRKNYNAVFVHMNQEYLLISGWLWKLMGKRMYLWRNHYVGSMLTDIAAIFCDKVFCTSKHSYTAKYGKTVFMPVGVDTNRFSSDEHVVRTPRSILFFARMSPSKRPEILLGALALLKKGGISFTASFYGSPLPKDVVWYEALKKHGQSIGSEISFYAGVRNEDASVVFHAHEVFVNASPPGMLDKTMFEASAAGCLVLTTSQDFIEQMGDDYAFQDIASLTSKLTDALDGKISRDPLRILARENDLGALSLNLADAMLS